MFLIVIGNLICNIRSFMNVMIVIITIIIIMMMMMMMIIIIIIMFIMFITIIIIIIIIIFGIVMITIVIVYVSASYCREVCNCNRTQTKHTSKSPDVYWCVLLCANL